MKNSGGDILKGLTSKSPYCPHEKVKAESMSKDAVRSSVAKSHSIGGRTA